MTRNSTTWPKSKSLWGCCSCTKKKREGRLLDERAERLDSTQIHSTLTKSQNKSATQRSPAISLYYIVRVVGVSDRLTTFQSLYSFFLFNGGKERRPPVSRSVRKFRLSHIYVYLQTQEENIKLYGMAVWVLPVHKAIYPLLRRLRLSSLFRTSVRLFISIYDHVNIDEFEYILTTNLNNILQICCASRQKYIYSHPFCVG